MSDAMLLDLAKNGILGVVLVATLFVLRKVYNDREADRIAHKGELEKLRIEHKGERDQWEKRYDEKMTSVVREYSELGREMNTVLGKLEKRFGRANKG